MIKKSITITPEQEVWIKDRLATGHFGNESEVLRELIRREQERLQELKDIRSALIEGEKSGISSLRPEDIRQKALQDFHAK
ncbi:MAG: type II toxin-antitoxin system ParD family antitoxin [Pseudomonadota bacterium]